MTLIQIPERPLARHEDIHDFIVTSIPQCPDSIIFDLDACPDICLLMAMHIRLSLSSLSVGALCPIIFASDFSLEIYIKQFIFGTILLTDNIYVCKAFQILNIISYVKPLNLNNYRKGFLDKVSIKPPAETGRHSLANRWGASVFFRLTKGQEIKDKDYPEFNSLKKHLYSKYILASTSDLSSLLFPSSRIHCNDPIVSCGRKRILFIDDEADKGWLDALKTLFCWSDFEVINEKVSDYESLSQSAKNIIETEDFDLYILDLRLDGNDEEGIYAPYAFSGTKILKKIKSINEGNQVIIFTASNKAWNSKALLSPQYGADGYYIKESPEFKFPETFSQANFKSFIEDAERCFERSYLKKYYLFKESIGSDSDKEHEIKAQLDLAFNLANMANSPELYRYSFLALFQVLEILASQTEVFESRDRGGFVKNLNIVFKGKSYIAHNIKADTVNPYLTNSIVFAPLSREKNISLWEKLAAIYLYKDDVKDNGALYLLNQIIKIRNSIIHIDAVKNQEYEKLLDINEVDFIKNFNSITPFFSKNDVSRLLRECAKQGKMKLREGQFELSNEIVDNKLGIEILIEIMKQILPHLIL